jgi:hypothetical protein
MELRCRRRVVEVWSRMLCDNHIDYIKWKITIVDSLPEDGQAEVMEVVLSDDEDGDTNEEEESKNDTSRRGL